MLLRESIGEREREREREREKGIKTGHLMQDSSPVKCNIIFNLCPTKTALHNHFYFAIKKILAPCLKFFIWSSEQSKSFDDVSLFLLNYIH